MIERRAIFSNERPPRHRLSLIRIWNPAGPRLALCGKNPSKADGNRDDPTSLRAIGIAERLGFGSLEMVNADTFITSSPLECATMVDEIRRTEAYQTYLDRVMKYALEAAQACDLFIAGWGIPTAIGNQEWRYLELRDRLERAGVALHHLGLTTGGWPKHPLARGHHRIPDNQQPVRWA